MKLLNAHLLPHILLLKLKVYCKKVKQCSFHSISVYPNLSIFQFSTFMHKTSVFPLWFPKFSISKSILMYSWCLCVSALKWIYCIHVYFSLIDCKLLQGRICVEPSLLSFKAPIHSKQSKHIWEMNQWINGWLTLIVVVEKNAQIAFYVIL